MIIPARKRGLTATMKREFKRRSAIEATIGHMKTDGRLDRNFLLGHAGDAANALLVAAAHNLRLILDGSGPLACLVPAGTPAENGETGYFHPSYGIRNINRLAVVQGRLGKVVERDVQKKFLEARDLREKPSALHPWNACSSQNDVVRTSPWRPEALFRNVADRGLAPEIAPPAIIGEGKTEAAEVGGSATQNRMPTRFVPRGRNGGSVPQLS